MATKKSEKTATKAAPAPAAKPATKTVTKAPKTGKAATISTKSKAAKPKIATKARTEPKKAKGETVKVSDRHPRARLLAQHGSKEALAKSLATTLARPDEDTDLLATQLKTASNKQLLRLAKVSATVKEKWGNREKLIAALGDAAKKSKDKDYLAKLGTYSLPQLLDLATASERRARA